MSGGFTGKVLEIDLQRLRHFISDTDMKTAELYLGGRGLGVKTLWDRTPSAGLDPLSPDNPLMFWPSSLSGLPIAGPSRIAVVTKAANTSPAESSMPHASTVTYSSLGGHFGPVLKKAGYDGLIVSGSSEKPVVLIIDEGKIAFRNATDLWGRSTSVTFDILGRELGSDFRVLAIGPAGENGVRFAGIASEVRRTTARGGAGAVMGSKKLKAIAVRGTLPVPVHNMDGLIALRSDISSLLSNWSNYAHWRRWGATPLLLSSSQSGMLTTKNFNQGHWPEIANLSVPLAEREFWVHHSSCAHCPLKCIKVGQIPHGPWKGTIAEGPGYSAGAMLGSNCGVSDLNGLIKLIAATDDWGLDPIATGNVLGFVMELYEKGILRSVDLDGLSPVWGHIPSMLQLIEQIASRQGLGEVLSLGVKKAAARIGKAAVPFAMHVKGQEMGGWNVPASHDFALVYGTANRGGSHQEGASVQEQNRRTVLDALCVCRFVYGAVGLAPFQRAFALATGWKSDDSTLIAAGERIWTLEKLFNAREGFRRQDDNLPVRMSTLTFSTGPRQGASLSLEKQEALLTGYYEKRGWNKKTSLPAPEKLKILGLGKLEIK